MKQLTVFILLLNLICCDTGTTKERWEDGSPKIIRYDVNRSNQREVHFYSTGQKKEEGPIQNDLKDGEWNGFYKNGALKYNVRFRQDIKFSDYYYYHRNGNIAEKGNFNETGQVDQRWASYFENGKIKNAGEYLNGQKVGLWELFDSLGNKLKQEEFYYNSCNKNSISFENNLKHGKWESWYLCDKTKSIGFYKSGLRDSLWANFWEFGDSSSTGLYTNAQKIGKWKYWYESGQVESLKLYRDSIVKLTDYWDETGLKRVDRGNGRIETLIGEKKERIEIYKEGLLIDTYERKIK
jgi:antitoxin component YwqK of YwqJK toxin-antitoxin module